MPSGQNCLPERMSSAAAAAAAALIGGVALSEALMCAQPRDENGIPIDDKGIFLPQLRDGGIDAAVNYGVDQVGGCCITC